MSFISKALFSQVRSLTSKPSGFLLTSWRGLADATNFGKADFDKMVKNNKVVIFMKGVPDEPRCGFSKAVVQIFNMHGLEKKFDAHDVLSSDSLRQGIKEYTNWPTIPQVFIDGEFVGGCDILIQMHQNGDLVKELEKVGIRSALLDDDSPKEKK